LAPMPVLTKPSWPPKLPKTFETAFEVLICSYLCSYGKKWKGEGLE
jgi:hypothetical protein